MPELPEVETTLRGIEPYLLNNRIDTLIVRNRQLRWPIEHQLEEKVKGQRVISLKRRGKFILIELQNGHLIVHLGMSGALRVLTPCIAPGKHDHVDLLTDAGKVVRYRDPRRFGAWLWTEQNPKRHKLIQSLGAEPLDSEFDSDYLYTQLRKHKVCIKTLLMNASIVVGIGNIYANEILYRVGIRPGRSCRRISYPKCICLVDTIRAILAEAVRCGGTTLKDFTAVDGKPGYFKQALQVYGRAQQDCFRCGSLICRKMIAQRSSFYCPQCQA